MEEIFEQLSATRLWARQDVTKATGNIETTTRWRTGSSDTTKLATAPIPCGDLDAWLAAPGHDPQGSSLSCIFKAVWVRLEEATSGSYSLDVPPTELSKIVASFGLDLANRFYTSNFSGIFPLPARPITGGEIRGYCISYHPKLAALWSWNSVSGLTQAIFFASRSQIYSLQTQMEAYSGLSCHRMLPAFLIGFVMSQEIDQTMDGIKGHVRRVEVRTGCHGFQNRREQAEAGELGDLTTKMIGCKTKLAATRRKIKTTAAIYDFVLRHGHGGPVTTEASDKDAVMESHISILRIREREQIMDSEYIAERVQSQIDALHNIVSGEDAVLSYEVAKGSKIIATQAMRDSAATKMLAIVALVFLPANFVATLFSMPVLDWNSGSLIHFTPGFMLYTVVATMTTVSTVAIYIIWNVRYSTRKNTQRQDSATHSRVNGEPEARLLVRRRVSSYKVEDHGRSKEMV